MKLVSRLLSHSAIAAIALSGAFATPAMAQEGGAAEADEAATEIIVTGSRIRRDPLTQESPVTFLDSSDIDRTGLSSIADVLQRLPSAGGALNSKFNNSGNFGNPPDGGGVGAGAAEIDLRYLGSRRTLVLVDGLRYVNGASASGVPGATDLNAIPESLIERVEVLQDGASPIYGSDAIAGVVNIITKKEQKGFVGSAQLGGYRQDDGMTQNYQLSFGTGKSESGTSLVVGVNFVKQDRVSARDRKISQFPTPGGTSCLDGGCSSATLLGRFIVNNPNGGQTLDLTLTNPVNGRPRFDPLNPTGVTSDFKAFGTIDRFNFAPFNLILTPSERYGGFLNFSQELGSELNFRLKAVYNHRESRNEAAHLPLFVGPDGGNGNLLDTIVIDASNPFNPFGVTLAPGNYSLIARRVFEGGNRRYRQSVDTFYLSGTLDGSFNLGERRWFWDVNAVYGRNDAKQAFRGNINSQRLQQALGPVSACTNGCVPFNLFGGLGSITQSMLDFVSFTDRARSDQELVDITANTSGALFDLPAGPVGLAVGYEYRDQSGSFTPDPVVSAGFGSDIPAQPTRGSFTVNEVYGELSIPILKDTPFFKALEASLAARYSDYSTSGSETTFKAGLIWRPADDLLFRGSFAQGFRAPTIGELFGTPSRFDQELADPCSNFLGTGGGTPVPAAIRMNCIAQGVPADGSYIQNSPQLSVITGGNRSLKAETSDSFTLGAVYSPSWLRDAGLAKSVSIEVNYFNVKVDSAIQAINANTLLGRCAQGNDSLSCAAISRTPSGQIRNISGLLQNIAGLRTEGIDLTFAYRSPETGIGTFGLNISGNILLDFTEVVPASSGVTRISREGTERGNPDQAYPKFKSTTTLDWEYKGWSASVTGRYIAGVRETEADNNKLKRRLYTDLQIGWRPAFLGDRFGITLGVNNVFNTDPPACISCGLNNFDPTTYDVPGQFGYIRLSAKF